ncbi:hypothetical protein SK128_016661, partial [Halocaridina rubra]
SLGAKLIWVTLSNLSMKRMAPKRHRPFVPYRKEDRNQTKAEMKRKGIDTFWRRHFDASSLGAKLIWVTISNLSMKRVAPRRHRPFVPYRKEDRNQAKADMKRKGIDIFWGRRFDASSLGAKLIWVTISNLSMKRMAPKRHRPFGPYRKEDRNQGGKWAEEIKSMGEERKGGEG